MEPHGSEMARVFEPPKDARYTYDLHSLRGPSRPDQTVEFQVELVHENVVITESKKARAPFKKGYTIAERFRWGVDGVRFLDRSEERPDGKRTVIRFVPEPVVLVFPLVMGDSPTQSFSIEGTQTGSGTFRTSILGQEKVADGIGQEHLCWKVARVGYWETNEQRLEIKQESWLLPAGGIEVRRLLEVDARVKKGPFRKTLRFGDEYRLRSSDPQMS